MNTDKIKLLTMDLQLFAKTNLLDDENKNNGSKLVTITQKPVSKTTSAETYDGNRYTFSGDNWIDYASQNGITSGLKTAITYPSYTNGASANQYINEMAAANGIDLGNAATAGANSYAYVQPSSSNNNYTTNNGVTTLQGYTPLGTYNDADLYGEDLNLINYYKNMYAQAQAAGDVAGMNAAHAAAEAIREGYGYSGGGDGSDYISLGYGYNNNVSSTSNNGVGDFYWNVAKPTYDYSEPAPTFTNDYKAQVDEALNKILNRDAFSYDVNADPLYQQYKNQYLREGQRAMNDTLASAAAGAGGMNSYAITAAQQAQNYYNSMLGDKIPELYNLAYDMYLTDIDNQVRDLGLLQQMDETQYNRYRDTMSDWRDNRDFAYGKWYDEMGLWGDDRDFAYGMYSDDIANNQWQQKFDYEMGRDTVSDNLTAYENAYNQAMEFLSAGVMPSADILAKAGISTTEAQNYIAKVVAAQTKSTGGGDDDDPTPKTKDPEPKTGDGDGDGNTTPTENAEEYEIWGGSGDLTDAYYSVSIELRRMSNQGKSKDEMADVLADRLEERKINAEQAASLRKNYGI